MKSRAACMAYITKNYTGWPELYHTGHAAISHYGYGWLRDHISQSWILKDGSGDVITKEDWAFARS